MDKNQIQVDLLGRSFKIRCEESPEHLRLVLKAFRLRIDQISGKLSITDPLKIAILAGIDLTDEILKLKKNLKIHSEIDSRESSEISLVTNSLIERINKSLTE